MEFKKNRAIFMQIADRISEQILNKHWVEGEKIYSVREYAAQIEVNPNTVMRTYTHLADTGIIFNKRGIGFFVESGANEKILKLKKKEFIKIELPELVKKMKLLGISRKALQELLKEKI